MSCSNDNTPFKVTKGRTWRRVVRYGSLPYVFHDIEAIAQSAPVSITITGHGIPEDWPVAVTSVVGMEDINAKHNPPRSNEFVKAHVVDADTIELNNVDATLFDAYVSGGVLRHYTPASLAGKTALFVVKDELGGTTLLELTDGVEITVDDAAKTITLEMDDAATAALDFEYGVYELALEDGAGVVDVILEGDFNVVEGVLPA